MQGIFCCFSIFYLKNFSIQNLLRPEIQVISGYQSVPDAVVETQDAVLELAFSVAVGVNHLLRPVLFGHPGKDAFTLSRIVSSGQPYSSAIRVKTLSSSRMLVGG